MHETQWSPKRRTTLRSAVITGDGAATLQGSSGHIHSLSAPRSQEGSHQPLPCRWLPPEPESMERSVHRGGGHSDGPSFVETDTPTPQTTPTLPRLIHLLYGHLFLE